MFEQHVDVTTKHGVMPTFVTCPDGAGPFPTIIFYMDAPGTREELRNMTPVPRPGYCHPAGHVLPVGHCAVRPAAADRCDVSGDPGFDEQSDQRAGDR